MRWLFSVFVVWSVAPTWANAQEQALDVSVAYSKSRTSPSASIETALVDAWTGGPIVGVVAVLASVELAEPLVTTADESGHARFNQLRAGHYTLKLYDKGCLVVRHEVPLGSEDLLMFHETMVRSDAVCRESREQSSLKPVAGRRFKGSIRAKVKEHESGEYHIGATVVLSSSALKKHRASITNGNAEAYFADLPPGDYTLKVYYADSTMVRAGVEVAGVPLRVPITIDSSAAGERICGPWRRLIVHSEETGLRETVGTRQFERTLPRSLPLFSASPHSEVRYHGLALGAADLVDRFAIGGVERADLGGQPAASVRDVGTIQISPLSGSNEPHTELHARAGTHGLSTSITQTGAFRKDMAWFALGAAPTTTRDGHSVPLSGAIHFSPKPDHQGGLFAASELGRRSNRALAIARWHSRFDNAKTELHAALGTARQTAINVHAPSPAAARVAVTQPLGSRSSTHGGRVSLTKRGEFVGTHRLVAAIEGYSSSAPSAAQTDRGRRSNTAALAIDDSWNLQPNITAMIGVRGQRLARGENVILPSVGFSYDWTQESAARLFGTAGRYLTASERPITQLLLGSEYEVLDGFAILAAFTRRGDRNGLELRARIERSSFNASIRYGVEMHKASESSFHRVDARLDYRLAECDCGSLWLGALLREGTGAREPRSPTFTAEDETTGSGLVLQWRHVHSKFALGLEVTHADDRMDAVVSVDWDL